MAVENPTRYQRGLRPVMAESLPQFIDTELQKIANVFDRVITKIEELEARVAALETP